MQIIVIFLKDITQYDSVVGLIKEYVKVTQVSIYIMPMMYTETSIGPGFVATAQIDAYQSKIDKLFNDDKLKEQILYIYQVNEKDFHLLDLCNDISISQSSFREWSTSQTKSFQSEFIFSNDIRTLVTKLYNIIYFLINIKAKEELIANMIDYSNQIQIQTNQKILLSNSDSAHRLDSDELSLNDNLLIFKQKITMWRLRYVTKLKTDFYEAFVGAYVNLNTGFQLPENIQEAYFACSNFVFIKYVALKYPLISIKIKEIHSGMDVLEKLLTYPIKDLLELNPSIIESKIIKLGEAEDKWGLLIVRFGFKNVENVLTSLDTLWEPVFKELEQLKWRKADLHLRLHYICYLLRTNFGLVNQRKINATIKVIESLNVSHNKVVEVVAAAEIQHLVQMKNYGKLLNLKTELEVFKDLDLGFLNYYLQSKSKELSLTFDKVDDKVFIVEYFDIKGFDFVDDGRLVLEGFLTTKTEAKELVLNNVVVKLKTDTNNNSILTSIPIPEVKLKQHYNEIKVHLNYSQDLVGKINYLSIDEIEVEIKGMKFFIRNFEQIKNKNSNLNKIPFLSVKDNGFLHKLGSDIIFFEPNGPNYFYIEFTIFDNRTNSVDNILLTLQKSSKYLIIDNTAHILTKAGMRTFKMKNNVLSIDSLTSGKYVLLLKIFIVNKQCKNYKLKLNSTQSGRTFLNYITLKEKSDSFLFLDAYLEKINDSLGQLHLKNTTENEIFEIVSINTDKFAAPKRLSPQECYSHIIRGDGVIDIVYKLNNFEFKPTSVHQIVKAMLPSILYLDKVVNTQIMALDSLVGNNELRIQLLDLKNRKEIKAFEQNCFIFRYSFKPQETTDTDRVLYIEFKWPKEKYVIIGKTRFELENKREVQEMEVYFIPLEGGYCNYPQVLLVEIKVDGSEHQLLLNDFQTNRTFFVQESIIKFATLEN